MAKIFCHRPPKRADLRRQNEPPEEQKLAPTPSRPNPVEVMEVVVDGEKVGEVPLNEVERIIRSLNREAERRDQAKFREQMDVVAQHIKLELHELRKMDKIFELYRDPSAQIDRRKEALIDYLGYLITDDWCPRCFGCEEVFTKNNATRKLHRVLSLSLDASQATKIVEGAPKTFGDIHVAAGLCIHCVKRSEKSLKLRFVQLILGPAREDPGIRFVGNAEDVEHGPWYFGGPKKKSKGIHQGIVEHQRKRREGTDAETT